MEAAIAQLDNVVSDLLQALLQALQEDNDVRAHSLVDAVRAIKNCIASLKNLPA